MLEKHMSTELKKLSDLRVVDLRVELEKRGLDKTGNKPVLTARLQQALENEGIDGKEYLFEVFKKPTSGIKRETRSDETDAGGGSDAEDDAEKDEISEEHVDGNVDTENIEQESLNFNDEWPMPADVEGEERDASGQQIPNPGEVEPHHQFTPEDTINLHQAAHQKATRSETTDSTSMAVNRGDESITSVSPGPETTVADSGTAAQPLQQQPATELKEKLAAAPGHEQGLTTAVVANGHDKDKVTSSVCNHATSTSENCVEEELILKSPYSPPQQAAEVVPMDTSMIQQQAIVNGGVGQIKETQQVTVTAHTLAPVGTAAAPAATVTASADKSDPGKSQNASANPFTNSKDTVETATSPPPAQPLTTGKSVWVSNLASTTRAADLKTVFAKYGRVVAAKIVTSAKLPGSKCFGLVTMSTHEEVSKCIHSLHRTELLGKTITVEKSTNDNALPIQKKPVSAAAAAKTPNGAAAASVDNASSANANHSQAANDSKRTSKSGEKTSTTKTDAKPDFKEPKKTEGGSKDDKNKASRSARREPGGTSGVRDRPRDGMIRSRPGGDNRRPFRPTQPFTSSTRYRGSTFRSSGQTTRYPMGGGGGGPPRPLMAASMGSRFGRPRPVPLMSRRTDMEFRERETERERIMMERMRQKELEYQHREEMLRLARERERIKYERERLERERLEVEHLKQMQLQQLEKKRVSDAVQRSAKRHAVGSRSVGENSSSSTRLNKSNSGGHSSSRKRPASPRHGREKRVANNEHSRNRERDSFKRPAPAVDSRSGGGRFGGDSGCSSRRSGGSSSMRTPEASSTRDEKIQHSRGSDVSRTSMSSRGIEKGGDRDRGRRAPPPPPSHQPSRRSGAGEYVEGYMIPPPTAVRGGGGGMPGGGGSGWTDRVVGGVPASSRDAGYYSRSNLAGGGGGNASTPAAYSINANRPPQQGGWSSGQGGGSSAAQQPSWGLSGSTWATSHGSAAGRGGASGGSYGGGGHDRYSSNSASYSTRRY